MKFELNRYPFLSDSKHVLGDLALTIERIDETNVFDDVIKDALKDIINGFRGKLLSRQVKLDVKYEVAKFYLTLYILRSNPTKLMARYWLKAYMKKIELLLEEDIIFDNKTFKYISDFLIELGIKHKFVSVDNYQWMIIKVMDYLDFAIEITNKDDREYQMLTLVNMPLNKGMVFIPVNEKRVFYLMILKMCEKRIKDMINSTERIVRSNKIDNCVDQLQKLLSSGEVMGKSMPRKELEYGETTPQMEIEHEQILKELFTGKLPTHINIKQFPPCINAILNKLNNKQEPLGHRANILLGSYLASRGFTKEQMIEVFKMALNYDPNTTSYNVQYLLDKKIKPYNCGNVGNMCFADDSCKRLKLTNPMNYRRLEK